MSKPETQTAVADPEMYRAVKLAEKIKIKADTTLRILELEMRAMKWPNEYRTIVWEAVAHEAMRRAEEARSNGQ